MGPLEQISLCCFQNPLPLGQSILVFYSDIMGMSAITLICFAISYLFSWLRRSEHDCPMEFIPASHISSVWQGVVYGGLQ